MAFQVSHTARVSFEPLNPVIPCPIQSLPNEVILKIFLKAVLLSQAGKIKLTEKTVVLIQQISLTCKAFHSLMQTTKHDQFLESCRLLPYLVSISFSLPPERNESFLCSMADYYTQSLSTPEIYERTQFLFPTQTPHEFQENPVFIEQLNLEKIYELITSELKVKTSNQAKIENKIHSLLTSLKNEVDQLFSNPAFLRLLMHSCSFVPLIFLEAISENVNRNQTLFNEVIQLAGSYSHPEIIFFILAHKAQDIVVARPPLLRKMTLPPLPGTQESPAQPAFIRIRFKRNFRASLTGVYVGNTNQLIEDLKDLSTTPFNDPQKQKDEMTLLVETALSFTDELGIANWAHLLKITKSLKNSTLMKRVLDTLSSCYNSLEKQQNMSNLDNIVKPIIRDAIFSQDIDTISSIKRFLAVSVLQRFIDEYKTHYANTGDASMMDAFDPFIKQYVLNF